MRSRARCGGFTYLGLIILVAIIGLVGAAALKVGALLQRAAAEEELLEIGAAFSEALRSYAAATPPGQPQQPPNLEALLKDPRSPAIRRHLRKVFVDPLTGKAEWGIMYIGDKTGVLGVYSRSAAKPLKIANFDARFPNFLNKQHIYDWKFTATGQVLAAPQKKLAAPAVPPLVPPPAAAAALPAPPADAPPPAPAEPSPPAEPAPAAEPAAPAEGEPKAEEPKPAEPAEGEPKAEEPKPAEPKPEGGNPVAN